MKSFPDLDNCCQDVLAEQLNHWSLANGLVMYPPNFETYSTCAAPVTLYPTPFPKTSFVKALDVQDSFNELYAKVSSDVDWLSSVMDELIALDKDFTGKLWNIYLKAEKIGLCQPILLGLVRSDYMIDSDSMIKQIEFNAISVSFCGLSPKVSNLHKFLNKSGYYTSSGSEYYNDESELPSTESADKMADGLAEAAKLYNSQEHTSDSLVLFVVQPKERNVFDQRAIEYSLLSNHDIKSKRIVFNEIQNYVKVDPLSKKLFYMPTNEEVSVVYYRSGYGPNDYPTETEWESRLILETSKAIKCPTLLFQLSGAKKIQQLLTNKVLIEKYLSNEKIEKITDTFVNIYPLDSSEEGIKGQTLAFQSPQNYVLKPQREGGGNNIYKDDIPGFLKKLSKDQWNAYILMDLIHPPTYKNTIIRNAKLYNEDVVSELGIFGTIIWNSETKKIISNKAADYLLRSKFSSSNEGGVAAGFGCVDSLYLFQ